jgi:hypothetical protein
MVLSGEAFSDFTKFRFWPGVCQWAFQRETETHGLQGRRAATRKRSAGLRLAVF